MGEQLTGSQILCQALLEEGVELLFGYPGGAIMPFYHALPEYPGLRHVLVRHEQAAAHAADGYARASGRPGVCVATSGFTPDGDFTNDGNLDGDDTQLFLNAIVAGANDPVIGNFGETSVVLVAIVEPLENRMH